MHPSSDEWQQQHPRLISSQDNWWRMRRDNRVVSTPSIQLIVPMHPTARRPASKALSLFTRPFLPRFPIWTTADERRRQFCVKIPMFGTWANFFLVRGHQNLDDLDGKPAILTRRTTSRRHANRLSPSPQTFRTPCTLPVLILTPPSAVAAAGKVVITACMRKLLTMLNAMARDRLTWSPKCHPQTT